MTGTLLDVLPRAAPRGDVHCYVGTNHVDTTATRFDLNWRNRPIVALYR